MSHIDTHKQAYQDFASGDIEALLETYADDVVIHNGDNGLPASGTHSGKEAVASDFFGGVGQLYEELSLDPQQWLESGDYVTVLGTTTGKVKGTDTGGDFAHVWRWEGDKIAEGWIFGDSAQLTAAYGS